MQSRLVRSRTDKIFAGVCGGLGDYFSVDPVIVRLIFVLVTLTSGIGLPIYLVLWVLMPKGRLPGYQQQGFPPGYQQQHQAFPQHHAQPGYVPTPVEPAREMQEVLRTPSPQPARQRVTGPGSFTRTPMPPSPAEYRFDPHTGQPLEGRVPAMGETVNLQAGWVDTSSEFTVPPQGVQQPVYPTSSLRRRSWRTLGVILLGIGGLILLEQVGVNMALAFPALLILAGIILLRRHT